MSGQEDPQIKIELSNPNRFEIRNAPMVLQFGPEEIYVGGALSADAATLIFTLSKQEFSDLTEGEPVSFLYGPFDTEPRLSYGRLQKNQVQEGTLRLDPHFDMTKKDAVQRLRELQASIEDAEVNETLEIALGALDRSLQGELWLDPTRLDPIEGEVVFDHEMEALKWLMSLESSVRFPLGDRALLRAIMQQIVLADRGIAAFAIEQESGALLAALDLLRAKRALLQGEVEEREGDFVSAVEHYRAAWRLIIPDG
jgi:hypothetical protein